MDWRLRWVSEHASDIVPLSGSAHDDVGEQSVLIDRQILVWHSECGRKDVYTATRFDSVSTSQGTHASHLTAARIIIECVIVIVAFLFTVLIFYYVFETRRPAARGTMFGVSSASDGFWSPGTASEGAFRHFCSPSAASLRCPSCRRIQRAQACY